MKEEIHLDRKKYIRTIKNNIFESDQTGDKECISTTNEPFLSPKSKTQPHFGKG